MRRTTRSTSSTTWFSSSRWPETGGKKEMKNMKTITKKLLGLVIVLGAIFAAAPASAQTSNYQIVQAAGSNLTRRRVLNCTGPISCADNAGALSTTITTNFGQGTVTQITSITTGVTVNTSSGVITTVSASTAAQATSTFAVSDTQVTASSVCLV